MNLLTMSKSKYQICFVIGTLMLIQFVSVLEMNVVMPLAPQIANIFEIEESKVTLLNTGYAVAGLFAPIFGFYGDKQGLKKYILIGTALFSGGALMMSFAQNAWMYFISRSIIGFGYYPLVCLIPTYTLKIISYNKMGKVSGLYKLAFALGILVSPLLGSYVLENIGFKQLYLIIAGISIVVLLLLFAIPKSETSEESLSLNDVKHLFKNRESLLLIAATFLLSLPAVLFYNYFSIFLSQEGYSTISIGILYSIVSLGSVTAAILIIFVSDKLGKVRSSLIGLFICSIFILPLSFNLKILLYTCTFIFGLGYDTIWGLLFPVCAQLFKKESATFLALLSVAMAFTNVVTNIIGPILQDIGGFTLCNIFSFMGIVSAGLLYHKVVKNHRDILE